MTPKESVFIANLILIGIASVSIWLGWPRHHRDPGEEGFSGFGNGILFAVSIVGLVKVLTS